MDIVIRNMDLSDIPFVYNEEMKIFGKSLGEKTLYNEIMYNDMSLYFIAMVDGKRVGYVGSWLTIPNAEILNLFVSEGYRGHRIGSMLMGKVIDYCKSKSIEYLSLEVRISNVHAIDMYKRLGFTVSHIRNQYYENGEDAYFMILDLR